VRLRLHEKLRKVSLVQDKVGLLGDDVREGDFSPVIQGPRSVEQTSSFEERQKGVLDTMVAYSMFAFVE
jgi:hypothetical protein